MAETVVDQAAVEAEQSEGQDVFLDPTGAVVPELTLEELELKKDDGKVVDQFVDSILKQLTVAMGENLENLSPDQRAGFHILAMAQSAYHQEIIPASVLHLIAIHELSGDLRGVIRPAWIEANLDLDNQEQE